MIDAASTGAGSIDSASIDPGWAAALAPAADALAQATGFLDAESAAGRPWLPEPARVLRAFREPFQAVRVLLVGQDPYPTRGHPLGLAFAVDPAVRPLPRSLGNIAAELQSDVGVTLRTGDLSAWSARTRIRRRGIRSASRSRSTQRCGPCRGVL